jgi:hypothetical protein
MQRNDTTPTDAVAITPSDSTVLNLCGFYVGGAGNVAVQTAAGSTAVTFIAPPVGSVIKLQIARIMSTSTTATNIVGLIA